MTEVNGEEIDYGRLGTQAANELDHAGDVSVQQWTATFRKAVTQHEAVNRAALAEAENISNNKMAPIEGRLEQLDALELKRYNETHYAAEAAANCEALIETNIEIALSYRDKTGDTELREEINNYMSSPGADGSLLLQLATNPRYSAILMDNFGASMSARVGHDHGSIKRGAMQALGIAGTETQRRLIAAATTNAKKTGRARELARFHAIEAQKTIAAKREALRSRSRMGMSPFEQRGLDSVR